MRRPRSACLLFLVVSSASAFADTLGDLRARLESLQPKEVVRARIDVQSRSESSDEEHESTGAESVLAELGPEGLRIGWTPAQLAAALEAARRAERDPDSPRSGASLGQVAAWKAFNFLDHT
ncbi:MAG: hypothetical protein ACREQY_22600, partial [Candidatus Binatia bacterium]